MRIEMSDAACEQVRITSEVRAEVGNIPGTSSKRITLSEEDFYETLSASVGELLTQRVRAFIGEMKEAGIEADFKSAAVMLKVPHPEEDAPSASVLAIEKTEWMYNPDHGKRQVIRRWEWDESAADRTIGAYWRALHAIDPRFLTDGISHLGSRSFLPLSEIAPKFGQIGDAIRNVLSSLHREALGTKAARP